MTEHELAEALRARFREIRKDFPDVIAMMETVPDRRLIEGHVRCGACKKFHMRPQVALAEAAQHDNLKSFLDWTQRVALATWPKACLRKLDRMEEDIRTSRN